jgi:hypothetical protein
MSRRYHSALPDSRQSDQALVAVALAAVPALLSTCSWRYVQDALCNVAGVLLSP